MAVRAHDVALGDLGQEHVERDVAALNAFHWAGREDRRDRKDLVSAMVELHNVVGIGDPAVRTGVRLRRRDDRSRTPRPKLPVHAIQCLSEGWTWPWPERPFR